MEGEKSDLDEMANWNRPFSVKEWFNDIHDAEKALCQDFEPNFKWWMLKVLTEEKPPDYSQILDSIRASQSFEDLLRKEEEIISKEVEEEAPSATEPASHEESSSPSSSSFEDLKSIPEIIEPKRAIPRVLLKKPDYEKLFEYQGIESEEDDLLVIPPTQPPTPPLDILEDERSCYQKMLSMTDNEVAANWRKPIKKTSRSEMTLEEQSEFESAKIAKDFCKWLESIGMENLRIDEKTLKDLFDINFNFPATLSFCVDIKELPSVPKSIAELYEVRHKAEREITRQLLKWDAGYEKESIRTVAFGKCLPVPDKHKPWNKDTNKLWFWPKFVTKQLKSGRALWENLLGSEVLDYYCIWLTENPQQKVPEYLKRIGYIDKVKAKYIKNKDKYDIIKKKKEMENEFWIFNRMEYDESEEVYLENIPSFQEVQLLMKESVRQDYCEECADDLKSIAEKKEATAAEAEMKEEKSEKLSENITTKTENEEETKDDSEKKIDKDIEGTEFQEGKNNQENEKIE